MAVDGHPVADALALLEMPVVHMIEAFVPRLEAFAVQLDDGHAEAAPELPLTVPTYLRPLRLRLNVIVAARRVVVFEMVDEFFATVEDLRALVDLAAGIGLAAAPAFELVVLRVLVPLPVVLAAEDLAAVLEGAAVGLGMPFLVLPAGGLVSRA